MTDQCRRCGQEVRYASGDWVICLGCSQRPEICACEPYETDSLKSCNASGHDPMSWGGLFAEPETC